MQGGYCKKTVKAFLNKCLIIITTQHKQQFGPTHQPATEKRMSIHVFKTLPNPKKSAAAWMKKHVLNA